MAPGAPVDPVSTSLVTPTEEALSGDGQAGPDDEQSSVQEAVAQSTQTSTVVQPVIDTSAGLGSENTSPDEDVAIPDAEQASVSEAVERSTQSPT